LVINGGSFVLSTACAMLISLSHSQWLCKTQETQDKEGYTQYTAFATQRAESHTVTPGAWCSTPPATYIDI
jgi:hypothetical protein